MERQLEVTMTVDITVPLVKVGDIGNDADILEAAAAKADEIIRNTIDTGDLELGCICFAEAYDLDGKFTL